MHFLGSGLFLSTCAFWATTINRHVKNSIKEVINGNSNELRRNDSWSLILKAIPRTDSEYSLGLNRTLSVNMSLNEFGPMCSAGQLSINFLMLVVFYGIGIILVRDKS
jgi:hypothetical protein